VGGERLAAPDLTEGARAPRAARARTGALVAGRPPLGRLAPPQPLRRDPRRSADASRRAGLGLGAEAMLRCRPQTAAAPPRRARAAPPGAVVQPGASESPRLAGGAGAPDGSLWGLGWSDSDAHVTRWGELAAHRAPPLRVRGGRPPCACACACRASGGGADPRRGGAGRFPRSRARRPPTDVGPPGRPGRGREPTPGSESPEPGFGRGS
jgi:hypothetical protein